MNHSSNHQGMSVQASGGPGAPETASPQANAQPAQTPQPTSLDLFDHVAAFVQSDAGKVTLSILGAVAAIAAIAAIAKRRDPTEEDEDAASDELTELVATLQAPSNRIDANRRAGARYERAVEGVLEDMFDGSEVWSQVTVTTPDGRTRRPDNVFRHRNGTMTAVEIKNVLEVTEQHVQQAEAHREGLRYTFGVRAGKTLLVVPEGTKVKPEHESRVRVRTFSSKRG